MDYLKQSSLSPVPLTSAIKGKVELPGSKSITNRALLLAALAVGKSRLRGALASDDTRYMSEALEAMGVPVRREGDSDFVVEGNGCLDPPAGALFLGNAGTATRFLTAAVATQRGRFVVDGDEHMRKRPIAPLVEALSRLGVEVRSDTGCPPVVIEGRGGFSQSQVEVDAGLSSQYISALLMAAPLHHEPFTLSLSGPEIGARGYIDITMRVMRSFGGVVEQTGESRWLTQPGGYHSVDEYCIEPDASAATYLWALERMTGGSIDLGVDPQSMMQPDARAWDLIQTWPRLPSEINGSQMQDAIPTLAAMAAFNKTLVRFVGIANLRVKECDRIAACCNALNELKPGLAEEVGDDLVVHSDPGLVGSTSAARIETCSDHRMAMAFSLAGLLMSGVTILDPSCVAKTYPGYWDDLTRLGVVLRKG